VLLHLDEFLVLSRQLQQLLLLVVRGLHLTAILLLRRGLVIGRSLQQWRD
jgi:hypothetical protein